MNNSIWPDWMRWDDILIGKMIPHNMETAALGLAELLSAMIEFLSATAPSRLTPSRYKREFERNGSKTSGTASQLLSVGLLPRFEEAYRAS